MTLEFGFPNPHARRDSRRRGRSALLALKIAVVLVVLAGGTLALASYAPKQALRAEDHTHASEIAASTVERLLHTPYDNPDLGAGNHSDAANPHPGDYYVSWSVEDNQPISLCKRITVTVRWPLSTSSNSVRLVAVTPESNQ
jgi:hypothetical protein